MIQRFNPLQITNVVDAKNLVSLQLINYVLGLIFHLVFVISDTCLLKLHGTDKYPSLLPTFYYIFNLHGVTTKLLKRLGLPSAVIDFPVW